MGLPDDRSSVSHLGLHERRDVTQMRQADARG